MEAYLSAMVAIRSGLPQVSVWRHVLRQVARQYRDEGLSDAARVLVRTSGIALHKPSIDELLHQDVFAKYIADDADADVLQCVSHRFFLAIGLSFRQRIDCAISHFFHEGRHYSEAYHEAVYRGKGLELWHQQSGGSRYAIWLRSPRPLRHEGLLSLVLTVDERWLHETSFGWVDAQIFGSANYAGSMLFVTRNQSARFDARDLIAFRQAFPHNSPQYFCLAAVHGIAELNRQTWYAGVKHRSQIAFDQQYAKSFESSYCDFWRAFGGVELPHHAFVMPVPTAVPPLDEVKAKHRARARDRRMHWERINQSSRELLAPHYRPPAP